jgi:hypothetical protein
VDQFSGVTSSGFATPSRILETSGEKWSIAVARMVPIRTGWGWKAVSGGHSIASDRD